MVYELFQDLTLWIIIKVFFFCHYVCLHKTWVKSTVEQNQKNFQILLIVCLVSIAVEVTCLVYSQQNAQSRLYFASTFKANRRIFLFSVQNSSSCLLTVSQTTKAPISSGVPLDHRAVCSVSIFLLTVSIVLIMHGAWVHRALLLILLRWICSFGLLWRCGACVWITASSVSQSPAPTCTSPLMNSPAAHYWRHFTVV